MVSLKLEKINFFGGLSSLLIILFRVLDFCLGSAALTDAVVEKVRPFTLGPQSPWFPSVNL